jgi:hypothetical protein
MKQYCVFTGSPDFADILAWLHANTIRYQVHLNRTRFWVPEGRLHTEFVLRWYQSVSHVVDNEDLATGWRHHRSL